jgi:hypothetical protein
MSGSFTANTTSTFYTSQCGNYNATTNTGYISGGKLYANDVRHESSLTESSHWVLYSNSLAANNPGSGIEGQTAVPGTQMAAFNAQVNLATQTLLNQIYSDTGGNENTVPANSQNSIPYGVSYDANDVFQGNINTGPPYATCTQR